jgi:hypothetical protein
MNLIIFSLQASEKLDEESLQQTFNEVVNKLSETSTIIFKFSCDPQLTEHWQNGYPNFVDLQPNIAVS